MKNTIYTIITFTTLRYYDIIRHYNIYFMNLINNIEVTRYLFKVNQAIFLAGAVKPQILLITLRESRELIRKRSESSYFSREP
jgi:hypothetical protein